MKALYEFACPLLWVYYKYDAICNVCVVYEKWKVNYAIVLISCNVVLFWYILLESID